MKRGEKYRAGWASLSPERRAEIALRRLENDPETVAVNSAIQWAARRNRKLAAVRERFHAFRAGKVAA